MIKKKNSNFVSEIQINKMAYCKKIKLYNNVYTLLIMFNYFINYNFYILIPYSTLKQKTMQYNF